MHKILLTLSLSIFFTLQNSTVNAQNIVVKKESKSVRAVKPSNNNKSRKNVASGNQQTSSVSQGVSKEVKIAGMPEDFPSYFDTGNPAEDRKRHEKAKYIWVKNNPERYKALLNK